MDQFIEKSVLQIVGNPICVEALDGEKVANVVKTFLMKRRVLF